MRKYILTIVLAGIAIWLAIPRDPPRSAVIFWPQIRDSGLGTGGGIWLGTPMDGGLIFGGAVNVGPPPGPDTTVEWRDGVSCFGEDVSTTVVPALVLHGAPPARVISGRHTRLCLTRDAIVGPGGEIFVLNQSFTRGHEPSGGEGPVAELGDGVRSGRQGRRRTDPVLRYPDT